MKHKDKWEFTGENGDFKLDNPDKNNYLYFPLANEAGMMSAITPRLHGDIKTGQNRFAMQPVSLEDLHNTKSARNFWVYTDNDEVWSATGNSAVQFSQKFTKDNPEEVKLEAGPLWHKIIRENTDLGLKSEITNFVPVNEDTVELMEVKLTNTGSKPVTLTPTAAIPVYGRSADNLRDHRHVTSLLHRTETTDYGIIVKPTLSFDERGHTVNDVTYGVFGGSFKGEKPLGFFPVIEDFIGNGGNLEWPETIVANSTDYQEAGESIDGYETIGALRFADISLDPGEITSYIIGIAIDETGSNFVDLANKYCNQEAFNKYLAKNKEFWKNKLDTVQIESGDSEFNNWMRWITLQPILRRIYGCSFLPSHDYGRGGRGWRDLWQDCLALLLMEPEPVRELLYNNFSGVRIDGSNATIIGAEPGEFKADRNNIRRVWMDHGAWPFLTTKLYIDQSGDLEFLLREQSYFENGSHLLDRDNNIYQGNIIEHFLVQHLTNFFEVGENNNFLLRNGDWNDGLDMAADKGESVAFTALYGSNLLELADLLKNLKEKESVDNIELARELLILLDTINAEADYDSVDYKSQLLNEYYNICQSGISGQKIKVSINNLVSDLETKGNWIIEHLNRNEWIENKEGYNWYNGYYDNDGQRLEGDHPKGTRMTLTGQVFPIMAGVPENQQIEKIVNAVDHYLKDKSVGGYRLNTDFKEVKTNLGRLFGFAYGHKENGAMFSHMAVMYGNALYKQGFASAGYEVIDSIYQHCKDFETSRIYPGIPEYINQRGQGMYHYLTGSASWLLLTMVTEVFGVRGQLGDLVLDPKLVPSQFNQAGKAGIGTIFASKFLNITYINEKKQPVRDYVIKEIKLNGQPVNYQLKDDCALISREIIAGLDSNRSNQINVVLSKK
ncbi:MAG: GH36-type glycosyl hydrolase domain-containing protein [Bacillota bacterium]